MVYGAPIAAKGEYMRTIFLLVGLLALAGCLFPSSQGVALDPAVQARTEAALRSPADPALAQAGPMRPLAAPVQIAHAGHAGSYRYALDKITQYKSGSAFSKSLLAYTLNVAAEPRGERLAWDVVVSDVSYKGQNVPAPPLVSAVFTTDRLGQNLADYQDRVSDKEPKPTDLEFLIPNFTYRKGPFTVGDEVMALHIDSLASPAIAWTLPADARGFVLQGVRAVNGRPCYALAIDVDGCRANIKGTIITVDGAIHGVEFIDVETGAPWLYEISLTLTTPWETRFTRRFTLIPDIEG